MRDESANIAENCHDSQRTGNSVWQAFAWCMLSLQLFDLASLAFEARQHGIAVVSRNLDPRQVSTGCIEEPLSADRAGCIKRSGDCWNDSYSYTASYHISTKLQ